MSKTDSRKGKVPITRRVEIRMLESQRLHATMLIKSLEAYAQQYINSCAEVNAIIDPYDYDYEHWRDATAEDDVMAHVSEESRIDALATAKRQIETVQKVDYRNTGIPTFRVRPITSVRLGKSGVGIYRAPNLLMLPFIGEVYIKCEGDYIPEEERLSTTSVTLVRYPMTETWYATVHCYTDASNVRPAPKNSGLPIHVEFTLNPYVTLYRGDELIIPKYQGSESLLLDEKSYELRRKMKSIEESIRHKEVANLVRYGYESDTYKTRVKPGDRPLIYRTSNIQRELMTLGKMNKTYHNRVDIMIKALTWEIMELGPSKVTAGPHDWDTLKRLPVYAELPDDIDLRDFRYDYMGVYLKSIARRYFIPFRSSQSDE